MSEIKQMCPETQESSSVAAAPLDRRVQRTRRQILEATVELLKTRGLDGFTMDAIADAAGVSRSTLYRHWPQLHDVLFDALQHLAVEIDARSTPPTEDGPTEQCVVSSALVIGRMLRDDTWRTLVVAFSLAAEHNGDAAAIYDRCANPCRASVVDIVRAGQSSGTLPAELDPEWVTDLIVAPIYMNAMVFHRPMTDEQIVTHIDATFTALTGSTVRRPH